MYRSLDGILDEVKGHAPHAMLIVVSNPVEVLTFRAWCRLGWAGHRIIGQAGALDSSRMASFVAVEAGFPVEDINAIVLRGHGDSMVPVVPYTTTFGIPVSQFLDPAAIERIVGSTRVGGAKILALKQTSSAYGAPAAAIAAMVDAIARNRKRVWPTVAILQGEYGQRDVAMGGPCILGERRMERVVELI
jgi:malate dehydrogenase